MADLAADIPIPDRTAALSRALSFLAERPVEERERWALWLPVAMGIGIALYFQLRHEPPAWLGGVLAVGLLAVAIAAMRSPHRLAGTAALAVLPLAAVAGGFALAQIETARIAAPMLDRPLGIVPVEGRVVDIEAMADGTRVTLAPTQVGTLAHPPALVRVKLRASVAPPTIGDRMSLKASLVPPPGPALPDGFDFQRQAFYRGLGGVGYAVGKPVVTPAAPSGIAAALRELRQAMTDRIRAALPPETGGIAAALITGERGAVPAGINQDYRDSGLAHLLVIAGLHMTLVTGFVFFAVRGLLALIPAVALRYPIKKWAAGSALAVACLYLVISGAAVPTQRAFVMVALGLAAIMIDRLQISMRGVAWAAGIVLALHPSALVGVSFQMSFAAVIGLVAFYETFGAALAQWRSASGTAGRAGLHLVGIALTTIVATIGTAAFSIYHFNRFALFSVLANVIAVPLAGLWVMPWAFIACLLLPLGLERLALVPMGWGIEAIEAVAHWTATLPYAVLDLPAMPGWGLALIALGGLWLAIWQTRWRRWGLVPMALGAASLLAVTPPDVLAAADGRLAALHTGGGYLLSSAKSDKIEAEDWLRAAGGVSRGLLPEPGTAADDVRCDPAGCLWHSPRGLVALIREPAAIEEDCRNAVLVVALIPVPRACRETTTVVDHADLRKNGSTAIWLGSTFRIETADGERGDRPWVIRPAPYTDSVSSAAATPPDVPAP